MFTKKRLSEITGLSRQSIHDWLKKGLLVPASHNKYGKPLFTQQQADQIIQVLQQYPVRPSYHAPVIQAS